MLLTSQDIAEIRASKGMNLKEFGELLGVAEATVSRWEAGLRRPKYDMMEKLSTLKDQKPRKQKGRKPTPAE